MDIKELRVQIAIGSLKDFKAIAEVVKNCDDPGVIKWASRHKRAAIRREAAKKSCLPFGVIMRMLFLDKSKTVKTAAAQSLGKGHFEQLLSFLDSIEDFPQTSLPFSESPSKIDYTIIDGPGEYKGEWVADAVQVARDSYERSLKPGYEEVVDTAGTLEEAEEDYPF